MKKIPNTTSFRAKTVQQGVGEILTKNVCPTMALFPLEYYIHKIKSSAFLMSARKAQ